MTCRRRSSETCKFYFAELPCEKESYCTGAGGTWLPCNQHLSSGDCRIKFPKTPPDPTPEDSYDWFQFNGECCDDECSTLGCIDNCDDIILPPDDPDNGDCWKRSWEDYGYPSLEACFARGGGGGAVSLITHRVLKLHGCMITRAGNQMQ